MSPLEPDDAEKVLTAVWNGLEVTYNRYRAWVFEKRAENLVAAAGIGESDEVLDLGTGTGIAAFKALEKVGPRGRVVGVDTSEGLLGVAKREASMRKASNVEFKRMSMTSLELPEDAFDGVIGNYTLCCSTSYEGVLREAYRVLRRGGSLTYNHEGPHQHSVVTIFNDILAKYKVGDPSRDLVRFREANTMVEEGWAAYKDPFVALEAVRLAGFTDYSASVSFERLVYPSVEDYLDYKMMGSVELEAMSTQDKEAFKRELTASLKPLLSEEGLVLRQEVLTLSGTK